MISQIRWKKEDEIELKKAVNAFNAKIRRLENKDIKYLPKIQSYKEEKARITSRDELERYIKSLRKFGKRGAEEEIKLKSGESITKWELRELNKNIKIAKKRLNKEYEKLKIPNEQGFTRLQMGSVEGNWIEAELKRLDKLAEKKGYQFKNLKTHIKYFGTTDWEMRKAIVYRENYLNTLESFKKLDGYNELMKKINTIKNPIAFFEFMKKSGDINVIDIHYVSNNTMTQEGFYSYIEKLGIELEHKNNEVIKNI